MFPFYAVTFSMAVSGLRSAAHSLALVTSGQYPEAQAWDEAEAAVRDVAACCKGVPLEEWLVETQKLERAAIYLRNRNPHTVAVFLMELDADLRLEVIKYEALLIPPARRLDYVAPLQRFDKAATAFPDAQPSMTSASKCYALDEWDASVFHSMRVLEQGLRWLAAQFPNLTLKKPVELENWENIIGNIQARINDELKANAPRTPTRDQDLAFYGRTAAEFRYFKDAWRNHVMHDRNDPYDESEATRVLVHVASFMSILAERV